MDKQIDVKRMLEDFDSTGKLQDSPDLIKAALHAYNSMIQASFSIPETGLIRKALIQDMHRLEGIYQARYES